MDSGLYIKRAENELKLSGIIFRISGNPKMQTEIFDVKDRRRITVR